MSRFPEDRNSLAATALFVGTVEIVSGMLVLEAIHPVRGDYAAGRDLGRLVFDEDRHFCQLWLLGHSPSGPAYKKSEPDSQGGVSCCLAGPSPYSVCRMPLYASNLAERSSSAYRDDDPILKRSGDVPCGGYSFSDTGSDSFFGDFRSNKETSSRPEAGTPTLPSRTISLALRLRP